MKKYQISDSFAFTIRYECSHKLVKNFRCYFLIAPKCINIALLATLVHQRLDLFNSVYLARFFEILLNRKCSYRIPMLSVTIRRIALPSIFLFITSLRNHNTKKRKNIFPG